MAASIDVVVPVYGRYELTASCLQCLAAQTVRHHVIVVDDGSSDDTVRRVHRDWPDATLVELGGNQGFTRAVNAGVSTGEGDYVVLLNNDVRLHPHCLEHLAAPMQADAAVGSVAALVLTADEQTIDSFGITADDTLAGFARLQGQPISAALDARPVLTGPEGTAGAYRRSAWEQAGGLDERIGAYMEVLDLALRLGSAGWKSAAAADAVGVHLGSSTYGSRSELQRRLAGFSRGYLLRRYGVMRGKSAPRALVTESVVVAGDAILTRDLGALQGRMRGWRAARGMPRRPPPPRHLVDASITMCASLALRRRAVSRRLS